MIWMLAPLLVLGFVFLARESTLTELFREVIRRRAAAGKRFSKFMAKALDCAPCTAAYCAPPSVALIYYLPQLGEIAAPLLLVFFVGPIASTGLLYALTLLSPVQFLASIMKGPNNGKK